MGEIEKLIEHELKESNKESNQLKMGSDVAKDNLILALKTNLGAEIKKNPGKAKIHKKSTLNKVLDFIKRIFTTF